MTRPDVTTLPASDLDLFLFAGVGTQTNGDELTVLSLLARLGSDPWVEAASLALLPRQAATDWLAERIATMPLGSQAIGGARDTAARLLVLLPTRSSVQRTVAGAKEQGSRTGMWILGAMAAAALLGLLGITLNTPTAEAPGQTIQGAQ